MRYFTLYGAHGGRTNPIQLPFRVAKAKQCMQTTGIWRCSSARGKKSDKPSKGFGQMHQHQHQGCHGLRDNRGMNSFNIRGLKGLSLYAVSLWPYKTERDIFHHNGTITAACLNCNNNNCNSCSCFISLNIKKKSQLYTLGSVEKLFS